MDAKTRERFDTYRSLFQHPGWELFLREFITPDVERIPAEAFATAQSWEHLLAARAKYAAAAEIASLEETITMEERVEEERLLYADEEDL